MQYNFLGSLQLSSGKPISFSIHFNEQNGIVSGYSITNIGTPDQTKSDLSGLFFKEERSFQLQETQVLSTHSEADLNTFCFIHANLSFKGKLDSKRLEGSFMGLYANKDTCATGIVLLMEQERLEKQAEKIKKKIEKKEMQTNTVLSTKVLQEGDDFTINWQGEKLTFYIWDANQEDGDKVEVSINNQVVLSNFETKNKRKKVVYSLQKGENKIAIKALNIGQSPPNTSRIELEDSKTKYPVLTQLKIGEKAVITLVR